MMRSLITKCSIKKFTAAVCVMAVVADSFGMVDNNHSVKAADMTVEVTVDGNSVEEAAKNVNGLTYKGFGVLSGNSTSNLLIDYKYQHPEAYNELLQVFFGGEHPLMNHIKMEMGNDGNNSTGADSCTMRYEDEEADASRSPGFILAADAKKINPDIRVSILRWEMPAWVEAYWNTDRQGKGYEAVYKWYKETVLDAYEKYGYIPDYINPDKNETWSPDVSFIKWFKDRLVNDREFPSYMDEGAVRLYNNIKIVASDENTSLNIVPEMRKDSKLYDSVDAIGFHYSTGTDKTTADYVKMAEVDDKEVWYSEGCGSFSYSEYQENKTVSYGAGTLGGYQSPIAMCDCMIKSAVYSRKSHYIFQPAIGSFYEGSQYDHKELVSAREPWAGNIHYDQAIYCLAHFYKFAKTGWENDDNTAGIWRYIADASANNSDGTEHLKNENGNPSYMTLASPDKKDFSTIVVNNSSKILSYKIDTDNMKLADNAELELWETKTDSYMQYKGNIKNGGNGYEFEVEPFSIVTVTTLKCNGEEEYTKRLPADREGVVLDTDATGSYMDTTDNVLYADDYSYSSYYPADYLKSRGNEPRYTVDYSGAFVVEDGRLRQVLDEEISQWQKNAPNAVIGDHRWMNYKAQVDVELPYGGYAGIAIREQTGMGYTGSGYSLKIDGDGDWELSRRETKLASGNAADTDTGVHRLALTGKGNMIIAEIDGKVVEEYEDSDAELFGRVRLFSGWNEAYYDNLVVSRLSGDMDMTTIPYGGALIDNASDAIDYDGTWNIAANGSSNDWYRTTSKSSSAGASFTFNINSDAFVLIGENSSARIDVLCDGKTVSQDAAISSSKQHGAFYVQEGLGNGEHEIKVVLKSGSVNLDAVMPVGNLPTIVQKPEVKQEQQDGSPSAPEQSPAQPAATSPQITAAPEVTSVPSAVPVKKPAAVKKFAARASKKRVKLTWKKSAKADGYVIERSLKKNKGFRVIKIITKKSTVKYIDKKASKGRINYYRIRCFVNKGKKIYSRYAKTIKVRVKK